MFKVFGKMFLVERGPKKKIIKEYSVNIKKCACICDRFSVTIYAFLFQNSSNEMENFGVTQT